MPRYAFAGAVMLLLVGAGPGAGQSLPGPRLGASSQAVPLRAPAPTSLRPAPSLRLRAMADSTATAQREAWHGLVLGLLFGGGMAWVVGFRSPAAIMISAALFGIIGLAVNSS